MMFRSFSLFSLLFLLLAAMPAVSASAEDDLKLTLVEKGAKALPILLAPEAPPKTQEAAKELADAIEKITGARPQLLETTPDPLPERAIWVGYQPALDKVFPEIDFNFTRPEEIVLAANGAHLVLAGRDRWDPQAMTRTVWQGKVVSGIQQEYGTANAVQTFLQEKLGVRWFWPGESGEDFPQTKTIALAPFLQRYVPPFRARATLFRLSAPGDGRGHSHDWARRQRLALDSLNVDGGHAFTTWWERFHKTHPEYFALQPDGTRSLSAFGGQKRGPHIVKLCVSNPAVWDQWLADVEEQLRKNPLRTVFNAAENDSWNRGICVCENCKAWDVPREETFRFTWAGKAEDHVALSDRYVRFWNALAGKLRERYPDRDFYVSGAAYGAARPVPLQQKPDERVVAVAVANHTGLSNEEIEKEHPSLMTGWGQLARTIWRPNVWTRAGRWGLPETNTSKQAAAFKLAAENGCIGIFYDTLWENWATCGPQYYLMGQLAWNPYVDADAVLQDYYARAFGPAAPELKAYWSGLESRFDPALGQPTGWTPEFLRRSRQHLDAAAAKVATGSQKYRDRVAFVRSGLDYTEKMLALLRLQSSVIERVEKKEPPLPELERKRDALLQEMEAWCAAHPHAINFRPVSKMGTVSPISRGRRLAMEYYANLWKETGAKEIHTDPDAPEGRFE